MLLHNQKSMYHMDDVEKTNLTDMVLVAINEVTKFNPENTDGSSYDFGVDFTNISPFNPYMISDVLQDLGYEDVDLDTNGWDHDYWNSFTHPDGKKFPPMQLSGLDGFMNAIYMEMKMIAEFILIWKMTRSMQIVLSMDWNCLKRQ